MNNNYVVATIKEWNISEFYDVVDTLPGHWHLVTTKEELNIKWLNEVNPRYIFFPHWSWIVPAEVLQGWECVCFHMADVPYGRGGSPLQNLIERGHKDTKLTALRMVNELDAGPVYKKIDLSLSGSAQEIFKRTAPKIYELIVHIVNEQPVPKPQIGDATVFKRRTPAQSVLPDNGALDKLFDHIRMLDAETYPKAFLKHGDFRIEFDNAQLDPNGQVVARVVISK